MSLIDTLEIRHEMSNAIDCIHTSIQMFKDPSSSGANAERMYMVGREKAKRLLKKLDSISKTSIPQALHLIQTPEINFSDGKQKNDGYDRVIEQVYINDHPELIQSLAYFDQIRLSLNIFEVFESSTPKTIRRAQTLAVTWNEFSSYMPKLLCLAAARLSSNEMRHYVIQTAYEELGMTDVNEIHPDMFFDSTRILGDLTEVVKSFARDERFVEVIKFLEKSILNYQSDDEILGMLLGLELPAVENIETLLNSLGYNNEVYNDFADHKFFKIHRTIEEFHIKRTVANFLRFCDTQTKKDRFLAGFEDGILFWRNFWNYAHEKSTEALEG